MADAKPPTIEELQALAAAAAANPTATQAAWDDAPPEPNAPRPADATTVAPLATVKASAFAGMEVPIREFLVEDMIPLRTPCLLTGDGGVGKSLAALQLAIAVSTGEPWFEREVKKGPCLFITAEDELDEVHRRLADICHAELIDFAALDDLHICSLAGMDAVIGQADGRTNAVSVTQLFKSLRARVDEIRPALLVLDTLADLFSGDENNRMQARQFVGHLRSFCKDFGTTVVLLSHPSLSGLSSGSGTSGSTAWNNSVRSRLFLKRPPPDDNGAPPNPDLRILETMKANYGKTGQGIQLIWQHGRFIAEAVPEQPPPHDIDDMVLALFIKGCVDLGYSKTRNRIGATLADVEGAKSISPNRKVRKSLIPHAIDRLVQNRKLRIVDIGPPSKRVSVVELPE